MRKIHSLLAVLAIFVTVFAINASVAFAEDAWCATDEKGYEYYVITERTKYAKGGQYVAYVKQISPYDHKARVLEWIFAFDEGVCWAYCKTDPSFTPPERMARNSELALSIIRFVYHYKYGDQYNSYID